MNKENMESIITSFNEHLSDRNKLFEQIQDNEIAIEALSQKPDVIAYLYLKNSLLELKEKLSDMTDDIGEFANRENYDSYYGEPRVWIYDYYYAPTNEFLGCSQPIVKVGRNSKKGVYRVYLGIESLKPLEMSKKAAELFEKDNEIIVLEKYNSTKAGGLTPEAFSELRRKYFARLLGKKRTR
jgi:hypothetical protein